MFLVEKVGSSESLELIAAAITEAKKIKKPIDIAICGPEGELISFVRMDGANPASAQIAQRKAYTSARDCKSTRDQGEFMRSANREQGYWADRNITGFGGGVPIIQNSKVIGGIAISGLSEEEDERIARHAISIVLTYNKKDLLKKQAFFYESNVMRT
jgi:glc operon protein GlcG